MLVNCYSASANKDTDQRGGEITVMFKHSRWRFCCYIDPPPRMSHIGFWRTKVGIVRGINFRFYAFHKYTTLMIHRRVLD